MCNITKCFIGFLDLAYLTFWSKGSLICATLHNWFGLFNSGKNYTQSVREKMSFSFSFHLIFHECRTLVSDLKLVHLPME